MSEKKRLPIRDEIAAYQREAVAERRVGEGAQCACGESRAEALISGRRSCNLRCIECNRKRHGQTTIDDHHVAGKANSPITMPASGQRSHSWLTVAQYDWPKETLKNPDGSPLLRAAASIRGSVDVLLYLIDKFILWIPEMLEAHDAFLVKKLGRKYWLGTEIEEICPEALIKPKSRTRCTAGCRTRLSAAAKREARAPLSPQAVATLQSNGRFRYRKPS